MNESFNVSIPYLQIVRILASSMLGHPLPADSTCARLIHAWVAKCCTRAKQKEAFKQKRNVHSMSSYECINISLVLLFVSLDLLCICLSWSCSSVERNVNVIFSFFSRTLFVKRSIRIRDSKFGLALVIESSQQVPPTGHSQLATHNTSLRHHITSLATHITSRPLKEPVYSNDD